MTKYKPLLTSNEVSRNKYTCKKNYFGTRRYLLCRNSFFYASGIVEIPDQSENTVAGKCSSCGAAILSLTACGAADGRETCGGMASLLNQLRSAALNSVSLLFGIFEAVLVCGGPRVSLPVGCSTARLSIVRQFRSRGFAPVLVEACR